MPVLVTVTSGLIMTVPTNAHQTQLAPLPLSKARIDPAWPTPVTSRIAPCQFPTGRAAQSLPSRTAHLLKTSGSEMP